MGVLSSHVDMKHEFWSNKYFLFLPEIFTPWVSNDLILQSNNILISYGMNKCVLQKVLAKLKFLAATV